MFRFKLVAYNTRRASRDLSDMQMILETTGRDALLAARDNVVQHLVSDDYLEMLDDSEESMDQSMKQLILDLFELEG